MRIYHNQLNQTLAKSLAPIWLVFGDEPWQKNDAIFQIKSAAKAQGFDEFIRFTIDDKFSWDDLINEYQSMSLFAARRVIELEFVSTKIGDAGSKAFAHVLEQLSHDVILLCHGDRVDGATTNKKWFKSISSVGVFLPLYDLEGKSLSMWLNRQLKQYQLRLDNDGISLLMTMFEGNVLALDQELQKLAILYTNQPVSTEALSELIINQSKFNPFALIDALLNGQTAKCVAILNQMQQEGAPVAKVIWFVNKELNQLKAMFFKLQSGVNQAQVMTDFKVWDKRKPLYQNALSKSSLANIMLAQSRLTDTDLVSKSAADFNAFQMLADVCICVFEGDKLKPLSMAYHD